MSPNTTLVRSRPRTRTPPPQIWCMVCSQPSPDPSTCARCGKMGHAPCLQIVEFQGHPFCGSCIDPVMHDYNQWFLAHRRSEWQRITDAHAAQWKHRALDASAMTQRLGLTLGGVVSTAASAAAGLATGAIRGAASPLPGLTDRSPAPPAVGDAASSAVPATSFSAPPRGKWLG